MKYFDQALTDFPQAEAVAQTLREGGLGRAPGAEPPGPLGPCAGEREVPDVVARLELTIVLDHGTVATVDSIAISEFKATCLAVLERVRQTGQPVLVTRRGEPVAEILPPSPASRKGSWLGSARGTGEILGDLVAPAADEGDWEALSS
jgi:prevent-host-death family protein